MRRHSAYERIAISLLALLAAAAVLPAWLAYLHDGIRLAGEVRIEAQPDRVWNFLVEPAQRTRWQAGVISVLALSEAQGVVGARSLVLYREGGPSIEVEEEILHITPPVLWRVEQNSPFYDSQIEITLSVTGEATLLRYREKKVLVEFTDKYMALWLRWKGQRRLAHGLARLKLLAEREAAETIPAIQ